MIPSQYLLNRANFIRCTQVAHMGWVRPLELPNGAPTRTFASPLKMRGERFDIYRAPPLLGEHTDEVLAELGPRPEAAK